MQLLDAYAMKFEHCMCYNQVIVHVRYKNPCLFIDSTSSRSARLGHLVVPATKTKTFGSRSFRLAAPTVWSSLCS